MAGVSRGRPRPLRLGGRASALSFWQLRHVEGLLALQGVAVEVHARSASGDRDLETAIDELPSEAPFVDDIETALLAGEIDAAVHSLKDLPVQGHPDLYLAALVPRGPVAEVLVSRGHEPLLALAAGAVVGTSSARRRLQLQRVRPDLVCRPIRGPVDGRVGQVRAGGFDAAILALAGLARLGCDHEAAETLPMETLLPAPGQGAIAVQVRVRDRSISAAVETLDDRATRRATDAERALQRRLEDADHVVAAHAEIRGSAVTLRGRLLTRMGGGVADAVAEGTDPVEVARLTASRLGSILDRAGSRR